MADEARCGNMHRLRDDFVQQKVDLVRHESRRVRNAGVGEVFLYQAQVALRGNDVILQKTGQISGDGLVNQSQRRVRRLGHCKDAVEALQAGFCQFLVLSHRHGYRDIGGAV